ncbi:hypothetical protein [Streptomyces sp. PA5.6]|uniref:hypothetical protein n=1 Tax=Streptomyces sp. PA5.6 TaxID=3035651 RepID=UPI00390484AB
MRPAFALTALAAALTLAACGTDKPADATEVRSGAAFTDMMRKVARSCPESAAPEAPPSGPARTPAADTPETPPPTDAIEPVAPTAGPEVELNARDWCASHLHEERIAQALWDLADPTPAKVRGILNDLGYVDERILDLRRSGAATRFTLDLRDRGGRLCLDGTANGGKTLVDKTGVAKCVAASSGTRAKH